MNVERVVVLEEPAVSALRVVSMPDGNGPWRSVQETTSGRLGQKVVIVGEENVNAERVYFVV